MTMILVDPSIPDPFGRDGYRGTFVRAKEREQEAELFKEGGFGMESRVFASPDVAYYRFANGWGAGVLLGSLEHPACSVATSSKPYEMAVLHGRGKICYASPITADTVCPLDAAGVRGVLDAIAALPRQTGCRHRQPGR